MVEIFHRAEMEIREDPMFDTDQWDSLAHINLVLEIEKQFRIKFSLGELQNLKKCKGFGRFSGI